VPRRLPPTIGLIVLLAPAWAHAQTNLDQGKSPAQIFATACVECHKDAHGLAKGKNSAALADFLHEHYTTSSQQAAALAAYLLGGRGTETGAATQGRGQKPAAEHATASAEEPKPGKHQGRQPSKPEDGLPATAKLHRPTDQAAKPSQEASPGEQPSIMTPMPSSAAASRYRRKEPKTPSPAEEPGAIAHAPAAAESAPTEGPGQDASPTPATAAPADAASGESGENAPVPRDHIPD
jgi:cytochrome c553